MIRNMGFLKVGIVRHNVGQFVVMFLDVNVLFHAAS